MSDLRELYQEVILDHSRRPKNVGVLPGADHTAEGYNPLCGDRLSVSLKMDGDVITDVRFQGSGCAISRASASLMTDSVKGKSVPEVQRLFEQFRQMVTGEADPPRMDALGKLKVFAGVREYPTRVKCATLAWHTLRAAVEASDTLVSTE